MSEQQTTAEQPQEGAEQAESKTFDAEYVDKLRKEAAKYRTEAKANAEAAKRLAEIEEAQKSEAEKVADRIKQLESEVEVARLTATRAQIKAEYGLSEKVAAALNHITSEEGMREFAEAVKSETDARKKQHIVPNEGSTPSAAEGDERETVNALFGS